MSDGIPFENGTTIGAAGSEGGTILRDELHPDGSRITLERTATGFAITCGVYGWMVHTRFFASESEAVAAYEEMKPALAEILVRLPGEGEDVEAALPEVGEILENFVARFRDRPLTNARASLGLDRTTTASALPYPRRDNIRGGLTMLVAAGSVCLLDAGMSSCRPVSAAGCWTAEAFRREPRHRAPTTNAI